MARLLIRLKKGRDGPHSLVCTRADGSSTLQRHPKAFFPFHDLTHYAVESVLDYRRAFYGLVAGGWDLQDFGEPWPRGRLPADLDPADLIVGQLDLERATGERRIADEFNVLIAAWYAEHAPAAPIPAALTDAQLARIRQVAAGLHAQWRETRPGETLELEIFAEDGSGNEENAGEREEAV
ncbi:MAG: hypothetical protein ACREMA_01840 [Longimicrobiales bacterium]